MSDKDKTVMPVDFEAAIKDSDIAKIYCNGFSMALGAGDITLILQHGRVPAAVLSMSFTTAKTLSEKLGGLIANLEKITDKEIMTTDDVNRCMLDAARGKGKNDDRQIH